MRAPNFWMAVFLSASLLSACGNGNDGKTNSNSKKNIDTTPIQERISRRVSSVTAMPLFCQSTFLGNDLSFNQTMMGTSVCPIEGTTNGQKGSLVRVRVNANFPRNLRVCLVPIGPAVMSNVPCFAIDGEVDVNVFTDQYTSLVMVEESNLAAYQAYRNGAAAALPPRIVYSL